MCNRSHIILYVAFFPKVYLSIPSAKKQLLRNVRLCYYEYQAHKKEMRENEDEREDKRGMYREEER